MLHHILYAKIFGMTALIISIGLIFHLGHAKKMAQEMMTTSTGYIMGGVLPTLIGSWVVVQHNHWIGDFGVIIAIVGWILLLLGIFRLWFVHSWESVIHKYIQYVPSLFALFGMIFGLLLCYVGFFTH